MARNIDDFGNAADGVFQHVVGMRKGFVLRHVVAQHFEQLVVEHHDQRINIGLKLGQPQVGVGHAASAFKLKRPGHYPHREDAHFLGHAGNHGRRAGAGTAAHASGDEQHVRAADGAADVFKRHFGGITPFFRLAAGAQTTATQLDDLVRAAAIQRLRVGVGADELNPLHTALNHVCNGIATATADTNDLDLRALVKFLDFNHFDTHGEPPVQ